MATLKVHWDIVHRVFTTVPGYWDTKAKTHQMMILTAETKGTSKWQDLPSGRERCQEVAGIVAPLFPICLFINKRAVIF